VSNSDKYSNGVISDDDALDAIEDELNAECDVFMQRISARLYLAAQDDTCQQDHVEDEYSNQLTENTDNVSTDSHMDSHVDTYISNENLRRKGMIKSSQNLLGDIEYLPQDNEHVVIESTVEDILGQGTVGKGESFSSLVHRMDGDEDQPNILTRSSSVDMLVKSTSNNSMPAHDPDIPDLRAQKSSVQLSQSFHDTADHDAVLADMANMLLKEWEIEDNEGPLQESEGSDGDGSESEYGSSSSESRSVFSDDEDDLN
jgi:hypothetical protein